jgi:diaminohydroxyphosphoribosylaminopyrimidine deaminase/5-amino-6-(5-phosphoribosylamino)uracil reductase
MPGEAAAGGTGGLDLAHMRSACGLARRGLGTAWPNPAVGCVLVNEGRVVGRGWTQPGGRPHAETEALLRAGARARGATAYVSLEPCCHRGETPPCAGALAAAGVRRVVAAIVDPDPRVSGGGIAWLRAAGIAVETGLCADVAAEINAGFFSRVRRGRPLVTLKLATTLDGRIAMASGESRWITGTAARARAHLLRARHDAVMVGIGTVLADDPQLTCRLDGLGARSPVRIVLDRQLRTPPTARLLAGVGAAPVWLVAAAAADRNRRRMLEANGAKVIEVAEAGDDGLALAAVLAALAARGITRLLVEGGARLAAGLLKARLVDRLAWFHAPRLIGGDGVAAVGALGIAALADAPGFERASTEPVGDDLLTIFAARNSPDTTESCR